MLTDTSKALRALIYRIAAGNLLVMLGFGLVVPPWERLAASGHLYWFAAHTKLIVVSAMLLCMVAGFAISWRAESVLRQGRENGLWAEEKLEPLRRRLTPFICLNLAAFAAVAVCMAFEFPHPLRHGNALLWVFLVPLQTISRLITILRGDQPRQAETQLSLSKAQPIHSQEWSRTVR